MCRESIIILVCAAMLFSGQACKAADVAKEPAKATEKVKVDKDASAKTVVSAEDKEAAYTKTIEKRTTDILALLDVKDEAKVKGLRHAIIAQYRFLRDWHETNDAKLKELTKKGDDAAKAEIEKIKIPLKAQHEKFIGELAGGLTPEQVEKVKNYIIKDKLPVTYSAYCDMLPQLTEEQKARIYEILKQGREEAMDAGSSEEKTLIFGRYKGKVNIYLSGLGINMKQAEKEWQVRIKARRGQNDAAATQGDVPQKDSVPATEKK
jgi:hypothetical protein